MKTEKENQDFFSNLPQEITSEIVSYLDYPDITSFALSNKEIRSIVEKASRYYGIISTHSQG